MRVEGFVCYGEGWGGLKGVVKGCGWNGYTASMGRVRVRDGRGETVSAVGRRCGNGGEEGESVLGMSGNGVVCMGCVFRMCSSICVCRLEG